MTFRATVNRTSLRVSAVPSRDPAVFVSVSATHQCPDGGGPVAAIVDLVDQLGV